MNRSAKVGSIPVNTEEGEGLNSAFLGFMEEQSTTKTDPGW